MVLGRLQLLATRQPQHTMQLPISGGVHRQALSVAPPAVTKAVVLSPGQRPAREFAHPCPEGNVGGFGW